MIFYSHMSKGKKLFRPEDFDKESSQSNKKWLVRISERIRHLVSNKKWILLVVAAIVVIACVIGFKQLNQTSNNNDNTTPETSLVDSTTVEKTDSVQTKENQSVANNTTASDGENEVQSETKETNASPSTSNFSAESKDEKEPAVHSQNTSVQTTTPEESLSTGSVEDKALQVIRGVYGNGSERKQKLGSRYSEIQSKVNDMYRNGLVH